MDNARLVGAETHLAGLGVLDRRRHVGPTDILWTSFHPLGTVRMGTDETNSIVDPSGRMWVGTDSGGLNLYDPATGQIIIIPPEGVEFTSINIDSASGVFTNQPADNLGGSFDNDSDDNIFKATFGSSF